MMDDMQRLIRPLLVVLAVGALLFFPACICKHKPKFQDILGTWRQDVKRGSKHDPDIKAAKTPQDRKRILAKRIRIQKQMRVTYSEHHVTVTQLVRMKDNRLERKPLVKSYIRGSSIDPQGRLVLFVESHKGRKQMVRFRFIDRDHVEVVRDPPGPYTSPYRFFERVKDVKKEQ